MGGRGWVCQVLGKAFWRRSRPGPIWIGVRQPDQGGPEDFGGAKALRQQVAWGTW